jgi:hypothetical protein
VSESLRWTLFSATGSGIYLIWIFSVCFRDIARLTKPSANVRVAATIAAELKPFAIVALVVAHIANVALSGDPFNWVRNFFFILNVIVWFRDKGDDDRWKRRRKRLSEKVTVTNGQLKVVPAGNDGQGSSSHPD